MLFEGAEWEKDDRAVPLKLFDFGPGQIFQKHRSVNGVGNSVKRKMENANMSDSGSISAFEHRARTPGKLAAGDGCAT